ncbi:aminomethyltransferase, mitochondrial [Chelonus insularis]|uniref:aminomethyltransferase, mitochondrial n=1 Tax=Chelonus insularis TaxID=460826 RepID=UPI00158F434A|nr:aminomethyltransferase, mitochondrial [Chelonus insularis]
MMLRLGTNLLRLNAETNTPKVYQLQRILTNNTEKKFRYTKYGFSMYFGASNTFLYGNQMKNQGNRKCLFSTKPETKKTCLYDFHVEHQGKMIDFAGWLLPVQYKEAIAVSHVHTRTFASLFDVGHMLQTIVWGKDSRDFLESLTPCDLKGSPCGKSHLTVFTNEEGGILDDLIITKDGEDRYFVVSNAGRRDEDIEIFNARKDEFEKRGKRIHLEYLDPMEQGLVALQGPSAAKVLQNLVKIDLSKLKFMNSLETQIAKMNVRISRCGYTGEDGFEISFKSKYARSIVESILQNPEVKLAGLGARDTLRLEAGLCLYGHDIDENTTPVEAGLTWLIAKRRREEGNFPGAATILAQIESGVKRKRVGLTLNAGNPPAREKAPILTLAGEKVGVVTSGGPSPTLGKPIAMGYVPVECSKNGSGVLVEVRGKTYKATVTKMPFIKTNNYTG